MMRFFENFPEIICGFSAQDNGDMSLKNNSVLGYANRQRFLSGLNLTIDNLVTMNQVHGSNVIQVLPDIFSIKKNDSIYISKCDGLITRMSGVILGVETADCLPLFIYDPIEKVIGAIHCGWRSVVGGIVIKALNQLSEKFRCQMKNLQIAIGPHIRQCHFEIQNDVLVHFMDYSQQIYQDENRKYVSLVGIVENQLSHQGVEKNKMEISDICTYCDNHYYSYRRDGRANYQSMLGCISLVK